MTLSDNIFVTGTQAEFDTWHATAKTTAGIPAEGKTGVYQGAAATGKQKTTAVSIAVPHPSTGDFFTWTHNGMPHATKPSKTLTEVKAEGFYPDIVGDA